MDPTVLALLLVIIILVALVVITFVRSPSTPADVSDKLTAISEKVSGLASLAEETSKLPTELTRLAERISTVEQNQKQTGQDVGKLATGVAEAKTLTEGIRDSTNTLNQLVSTTKENLAQLQTQTQARQDQEQKTARSIERLVTIIAGSGSKGTAGENILDDVFAKLPVEWQIRDLRIDNKPVEFALKLPNGLPVPIDSKWAATNLLEQYSNCADPEEQKRLKIKIEDAVLKKAKEVMKYIDPKVTAAFGIAAVPDAVYEICPAVQVEAFRYNVFLISYSMFLPYLLLIFQTTLKAGRNLNLEELQSYLKGTSEGLDALQKELEGRMAYAIKMMSNSRMDMSMTVSRLSGSLAQLQAGPSGSPGALRTLGSESTGATSAFSFVSVENPTGADNGS